MKTQNLIPAQFEFQVSPLLIILNIITIALIYAKQEEGLFLSWQMVLFPTMIYLIFTLYNLSQSLLDMDLDSIQQPLYQFIATLFFKTVLCLNFLIHIIIFCIYKTPNYTPRVIYTCPFFSLLTLLIYNLYMKHKSSEKKEELDLISYLVQSFFIFLGGTTSICSTGVCQSFYVSTFTTFFGAFGIPIIEWIPYINYVSYILIFVTLMSLYSAKKSWTYKPFLLGFASSIILITSNIFKMSFYFTLIGNIGFIGSAIWNSKLNKASLFKNKKSLV